MRCADLAELISAYADGQTRPAQSEFVEAHVAVCPRCQATLQRYRQTARLLRQVDPADDWAVPDLRLRLAHATAGSASGSRRRMLVRGLSGSLIAAVALCWSIAGPGGENPTRQVAQGPPPAPIASPCTPCLSDGPHQAGRPLLEVAGVGSPAPPEQQGTAARVPHASGGSARSAMRAIPL